MHFIVAISMEVWFYSRQNLKIVLEQTKLHILANTAFTTEIHIAKPEQPI